MKMFVGMTDRIDLDVLTPESVPTIIEAIQTGLERENFTMTEHVVNAHNGAIRGCKVVDGDLSLYLFKWDTSRTFWTTDITTLEKIVEFNNEVKNL